MKKITILLILVIISSFHAFSQVISIAAARALPVGSTVTVNGVATHGTEFGTIRYIQDGTAGIAVFSSWLTSVQRGDNITVTGVTSDYYGLLEITPLSSYAINSSGNALPTPVVVTPSQLGETYESQLVQINGVTFTNGGSLFQGNASYNFTSNGQNGVIYVKSSNPLVGQTIPTSNITLYGICSQNNTAYQVLARDMNDLVNSSSIQITVPPYTQNISTSGLDILWNTNINGSSFIKYGHTPNLELGIINGNSGSTSHTTSIAGAGPAELFYAQVYSVSGTDTAYSTVKAYITASLSSGAIKAYFDQPVDNSVANPSNNLAVQLTNTFDDTLKAYIDRSVSTLDIAIYNFDSFGTGLLTTAINDAYNRGVRIRMIVDGSNANSGLNTINSSIPVVYSPTVPVNYFGIMHNKFFVTDAYSSDANKPVVMTGSTNWSNDQLFNDRNNLIFIQDQSMAKVYTMEFEEMWGGNGAMPVPANEKFGPDKTDNTPHDVSVGGKRVECFFSPSDNTNNQILKTINTADQEIYFANLVFTRYDLAYGIEDRIVQFGTYAAGIVDDSSNGGGTSFQILQSVMGSNLLLFNHASQPGILHHKYLIVDQSTTNSDPIVLTGSHNWSSTANLRNDENIVIIHDHNIANQFYQEFHNLSHTNGGTVGIQSVTGNANTFSAYPNPATDGFVIDGPANATYQLFGTEGKLLSTMHATDSNGKIYFTTKGFAKGMYILKSITGSRVSATKMIVE